VSEPNYDPEANDVEDVHLRILVIAADAIAHRLEHTPGRQFEAGAIAGLADALALRGWRIEAGDDGISFQIASGYAIGRGLALGLLRNRSSLVEILSGIGEEGSSRPGVLTKRAP
jgi:hypothetical protein